MNKIFPSGENLEIERDGFLFKKLQKEREKLIKTYIKICVEKEPVPLKLFIDEIEKELLTQILKLAQGNQRLASSLLKMKPNTFNVKIKKYNIDSLKFKLPDF
ncbi:hypothetical protein NLB96_02170 [Candidatus Aminicenantes bacterium AC-335-K20]|jgi:DNA-binding protein Fis|nr:hypothetical protein [SCandidatus Aminicenantes bacterium Aminicenantia_JdfR_composite]MCP2596968.1 hypothetical protein [Candidatus Aminicenantes bacterium AC-335-G13]MCP2605940.1 hypothetical protein [Candidatus Aminicenantes bacterium AC-708-I09]MCP2618279.1 hypothetical protein [Candidatus Aminicenantes bacterium AC-335-A11]MCP2619562.1 hypothetical protein [Candidatus Aminicenantes bacterium AC-335-K20]MCP2620384.1 hypothetical protein [Candidatus Aminicenantes bacterium AC-334-E05]